MHTGQDVFPTMTEQVVIRSKPSASAMLTISHQVKTAIGDELYISVNTKLHSMQDVEEQKEHWAAGQV